MALPVCVKCGSPIFEMTEVTPRNSNFKLNFINCSVCGGVVGVQDFYNIGEVVKIIEKTVKAISSRVGA